MSILPGSPSHVLQAIRAAFKDSMVWPSATAHPDAYYQQIDMTFGYVCKTKNGFQLTEFGEREVHQP